MRCRSRISAMRPTISASLCLPLSVSMTACSAGSECSITSSRAAPNVTMRSQISDTDRTATAGYDDRSATDKIFKPAVIDLDAGPQQKILNGNRRPAARPIRRYRVTAIWLMLRPSLRARIRIASGRASSASAEGARTRRLTRSPRASRSATTPSRSSISPRTGIPRIDCPRSAADGESTPTGQIFLTAPLSMPRNNTSASAARPRTSVGVASANLHALERSRIVEVTVDDPQAAQEKHLQKPIQQDRDLAEKERSVEIRRHQHVVERKQRDRKHGRRAK